ncbi:MAG: DUF1036 domain-containing protein [Alphaproteobacteria bacterium]|nr:DUF1036 domain-containing protein [Alphaproteobacteria bacterium]
MSRRFLMALGAMVALAWPGAAQAQLKLCNQTSYVLYTATGALANTQIVTHGWTRVVPGECRVVANERLSGAMFLHAHSSHAHSGPPRTWGGASQLCTKETDFNLQVAANFRRCESDDAFLTPFATVDTKGNAAWTTTLTESRDIKTLDAARHAGITRLLRDIGYPASGRGANEAVRRDAALKAFRQRMKLSDKASPNDLFDALETEAMKAAAPQGYAICNDTGKPVWAALALPENKQWVTRGWWQIAPGGCAKAITDPLKYEKAYLRVERGPKQIVGGKANFCVTDIEFEVFGRDRCTERGLRAAGFAETPVKGRSGYAAHIAESGLVAPAPTPR